MKIPRERTAIRPTPIALSKVLVVEGETPAHFFESLAQYLELAEQIEIRSFGGVKDLKPYLAALAKTRGFVQNVATLGIVRDAESDPKAAKLSIDGAVAAAGFPKQLKVCSAILPDEDTPGNIETLCLRAVADDPGMRCVDGFFACWNEQANESPRVPTDKQKAGAFVVGKGFPEKPVGLASYEKVWPFEHPAFAPLQEFLLAL